jgi:hypothetical protein
LKPEEEFANTGHDPLGVFIQLTLHFIFLLSFIIKIKIFLKPKRYCSSTTLIRRLEIPQTSTISSHNELAHPRGGSESKDEGYGTMGSGIEPAYPEVDPVTTRDMCLKLMMMTFPISRKHLKLSIRIGRNRTEMP